MCAGPAEDKHAPRRGGRAHLEQLLSIRPPDPRCILVADDEHHIRAVVAAKLRSLGYEVIEAHDGEEALHLALEHTPDLVVTDLQMPAMSGLDLCMALKADPTTAHIPAILLTARGYLLGDEQLSRTNVKALMSKPFSTREVMTRVAELLAGNAAAHEEGLSEAA